MTACSVVLIRDSHFGWVELRDRLESHADIEIAGDVHGQEAGSGIVTKRTPDVAFVGAALEEVSLAEYVRRMRDGSERTAIVMLGEQQSRSTFLELGRAGALGYIVWNSISDGVIDVAVRAAVNNVCFGTSTVAEAVLSREPASWLPMGSQSLAERDVALLRGLARGQTESAIAAGLSTGDRTIERDVGRVKDIFGVETLRELRAKAGEMQARGELG